MRTLWESGLIRVWRGVTSVEELVRVLGERPDEPQAAQAAPELPKSVLTPERVAVGDRVRVTWETLSDGRRLPLFEPVD